MADIESYDDAALDALIYENPSEFETNNGEETRDRTPVSPTTAEDEHNEEDDDLLDDDQETSDDENSDESEEADEESEEEETSDEDTPEDEDKESEETESKPEFQPLKANGKEYPIDNIGELYKLASAGVNYAQKMQALAPVSRMVASIQKNAVSEADLNLLIDIKAGDQNAIMSLLKTNGIDPLDIDLEQMKEYSPKDHAPNEREMALDEVVGRLEAQPMFNETLDVVANQWDDRSRQEFYNNPTLLEKLNVDMQVNPDTGKSVFEILSPIAEKLKLMDSAQHTDLEYYIEAGRQKMAETQAFEQKTAQSKTVVDQRKAEKEVKITERKKAASPTGGSQASKGVLNLEDMTDAELDAFLAKTN